MFWSNEEIHAKLCDMIQKNEDIYWVTTVLEMFKLSIQDDEMDDWHLVQHLDKLIEDKLYPE